MSVCCLCGSVRVCDLFSVSAKGFDGNNIYVTATLRLPDCKMCVCVHVHAFICSHFVQFGKCVIPHKFLATSPSSVVPIQHTR